MDFFQLSDLQVEQKIKGDRYLQFLSEKWLSVGLYRLKSGEIDLQNPHTEEEVYYVISGRATIRVGTGKQEVRAGSIVYVSAGVDHKFNDIKEDLEALVIFAPAHKPA
jgi:mannose-6-phosphate isomerase-like protein (cupin superfamily)